jgi:drug/metabolite transporter (DMT)-like permease
VKTAFFEQSTVAVVLLPVVILTPAVPSAKDMMLLLLLGVVTTALAHTLFISALKNVPASIAGIFSSLETVYGILFAFIFLQEVPSLREIIGGLVIILAVTLSQIAWKRE